MMRSLGPAALIIVLMTAIPAQALTQSEKTALMRVFMNQLARCYTPALGQTKTTTIKMHLERNGSVADLQVLELQPNSNTNEAAIRAAERAIRRCTPFRIPAEFSASYDLWKHLTIRLGG